MIGLSKTERAHRERVGTPLDDLRWLYPFPLSNSSPVEIRIDFYETTEYAFGELIQTENERLAGDVGSIRPPRSYEKKWVWYARPPGGRGKQIRRIAVDYDTALEAWIGEVIRIMDTVATRIAA